MKIHAPNACPSCGKRISAMRLLLATEKYAFRCAGCGERLVKRTRAIALGFTAGTLVASLAGSRGYFSVEVLVAFLAALAVTSLVAFATVSVTLAGPDVPDMPAPAADDKSGEVGDGPPPVSPTFRGMSNPPPGRETRTDQSGR
jgi:predicted RNA-binding Zn-ribbon protein involved in translation (DUF1610 family)